MLVEQKNKIFLKLKEDVKTSCFLVDLKKKNNETAVIYDDKKDFEDFFEKLDNKKFSTILRNKQSVVKKNNKDNDFLIEVPRSVKRKMVFDWHLGKSKRLAMYPLLYLFYRVNYLVGFYFLFCLSKIGKMFVMIFYRKIFIRKPSAEKVFRMPRERKIIFSFKSLVPVFKKEMLRPVFYFFIFLFIAVLPFKTFLYYQSLNALKGQVLGVSFSAVDDIKNASDNLLKMNFDEAGNLFGSAAKDFSEAQLKIADLNLFFELASKVFPSDDVRLASQADSFLRAGELTSLIAEKMSVSLAVGNGNDLKQVVDNFYENFYALDGYFLEMEQVLSDIEPSYLPVDYQEQFRLIQEKSAALYEIYKNLNEVLGNLRTILGFDFDKRYLVVFQNNSELRGSGGFVGSFALVDFRNGKIKNLEVPTGGSYDTDGGLYVKVIAPQPLHLVNPLWHFWDANWWPDWEMSANKLQWFYEKSNGPSVDGVIGITTNVIEDMLGVVGEIDLREKYGVVINRDNFWEIVQNIVEEKPATQEVLAVESGDATSSLMRVAEVKHEPKKIIGDMIGVLLEKLTQETDKKKFISLFEIMYKNLNEKHILLYFNNQELQQNVKNYEWGGEIKNIEGDYLMVVNSNIAGQKTDRKIRENISLDREVLDDGRVINTLKIQRYHMAAKGDDHVGVRNVNWLRVYVPAGSKLISAEGFEAPDKKYFEDPENGWKLDSDVVSTEGVADTDFVSGTKVYQEKNKTVFANWSMVDPGEQVVIVIKYEIPFKIKFESNEKPVKFDLYLQKQPGSNGSEFVSHLVLPAAMIAKSNQSEANDSYKNILNSDRKWNVQLFKR